MIWFLPRACFSQALLTLCTLVWWDRVVAYSSEELALLQFAGHISNFKDIAAAYQWHGWGLDNNTLCPSTQITTTQELSCEPGYPGGISQARQSWTGITCTPRGNVFCLSLPGYGLSGNISLLVDLAPLKDMQLVNIANNSFTGALPANLPIKFADSSAGIFALTVLYLSNNSISGSLPAAWGSKFFGWGPSFQRLYLNHNQMTGQLPSDWSDSKALYDLSRLDLFGNELTGSIPWKHANMPSLQNLVLLPGNNFCGDISDNFQGVVRNYTGDHGPFQVLANVTSFNGSCATSIAQPGSKSRLFAIAGSAAAAAAGASLAVVLWCCIWRQRKVSHIKSSVMGKGDQGFVPWNLLSWHAHDSNEIGCRHSIDRLSAVVGDFESSSTPESSASRTPFGYSSACSTNAAVTPMVNVSSRQTLSASAAASTAYFTTRPVMTEVVDVRPITWPSVGPLQHDLLIPAPLWHDVEILPDHISIAQTAAGANWILGQGSYGMVYKGIKDGVHDVAIKIFKSVSTARDVELLQTEIAVLRSCNNRNIVHFYGVSFKGSDAWLVMELLEKGNLYNALAYGRGLCTWYNRGAGIALDIAKGLHFLHSHHVMHLDLKSPNILLAQDGTAKIADVGLSRMFTTRSLPVAKNTGTFHWMAPELISAGRCTEKADIFSFGIVLHEILTAEQPIRGRLKAVQVPEHCPQAVMQLMAQCQDERPENRPAATDIIRVITNNLPPKHQKLCS